MVFVNNFHRAVLGTPVGGKNHSGHGREHYVETLRSWQNQKTIKQPSGLGEVPDWKGSVDVFDS